MTSRDLVEGLDELPVSDTSPLPVLPAVTSRLLTAEQFQRLADVPPEIEWFANLGNKATRRAYENALGDFMKFTGIVKPEEFRTVTRAHVIAWRDDLVQRALSGMTVRHRLAALSSLFESLCEKNAVTHNPVKGVKRPSVESYEGKTPALGDHQARKLLDAPDGVSIKGKRDRAILATLLYQGLYAGTAENSVGKRYGRCFRLLQLHDTVSRTRFARFWPLFPATCPLCR
jgi:integrase